MIDAEKNFENYLGNKSFKKVFLICGKKSFKNSGAENFLKKLLINKKVKMYFKYSDLPNLEELIEIIKELEKSKPDLILAVGGGAVIDYAKIVNVVEFRDDLSELIVNYSYPFNKKFTKLAVIPTTAGAGAEVTSNAVIYVNGIKYSFESKLLVPDDYFLIPKLLISVPRTIKASSGFDAIAQALESLVSKKSNDKSVDYALRSLELSTKNYISYLNDPDKKNTFEMLLASNLAGHAINISKTTAPHAVSYPFSSCFNLSHGHAVSLFFESFFKFNYDNLGKSETNFNLNKRFELIFKSFEVSNIKDFLSKIAILKKKAYLEDDLNNLQIDIKKNVDKIMKGINLLRLGNNPVKIEEKDIYNIITFNNF